MKQRALCGARRNTSGAEFAKTPEQPLIGANHGRSWSAS